MAKATPPVWSPDGGVKLWVREDRTTISVARLPCYHLTIQVVVECFTALTAAALLLPP